MKRIPWALAAVAVVLSAQTPATAPRAAIEAASIKPNDSNSGHSSSNMHGQRLTLENVTLEHMVELCFGLQPYQVAGPDWLRDLHFDAAISFSGLSTDEKSAQGQLTQLLGPWLTAQFKIQSHHVSRPFPGYALVQAKGGAKLRPGGQCCSISSSLNDGLLKMTADTSMDVLAQSLARNADRPVVVNQTGLEGTYHLEFSFTPRLTAEDAGAGPPPGPSLITALSDLGLKLDPKTLPVDVLAIDRIERTPVGN